MTLDLQTIIFAALGGIIPAILWLWFWLREDKKRPEPRGLLFFSFIMGMIAVPLVIPLQKLVTTDFINISLMTIILWSMFEEVLKYIGSYVAALRKKANNDPIDPMIYLITTALGFAAVENTLFLINAISQGGFIESIITGNMRFIGATLLHTVSSATVGLFMAFSFYKSKSQKRLYLLIGLILAIVLHTLFNFFIMNVSGNGIFWVFAGVWILVVLLILFFEKAKNLRRRYNY
jgi:protease PrsW